MFDSAEVTTADLAAIVAGLARMPPARDDAERIDRIRLLEEIKSGAAAAQARETAAFASSQEAAQRDVGVPASDAGKGIAAQVGLAKRESPARARRYVGWAKILTAELPGTLQNLTAGRITEWRAQIVARETGWLSAEHRHAIDAEVAPLLQGWGDRRVESEVKKRAYRLDPHGYMARVRGVEQGRTVTLRPAPDTMSYLTGFLPVAQGVAVLATLKRHADSLRAQGDERSRGQIMADSLVERVTGQSTAAAVPVEVNVVMSDQALFNTGPLANEPAHLEGYGTIPAELARRLLLAEDSSASAWLRRLFTDPADKLVSMDSRRREFDGLLRKHLVMRDQVCRTPWCDAPIRHADHVTAVVDGGATEAENGQGLCEACNYAKQAPGWRARASGGGAGTVVEITTPTGHRYRSRPPKAPRSSAYSRCEYHFSDLVAELA